MEEIQRQRLRIRYAKGESIKFISHQDEFRTWERTLRRADLPLLYKGGFNPQPSIQFAAPLGVGFTGLNEHVDIILSPPVRLIEATERIRAALPPGITVQRIDEIDLHADALANTLIGADYTILLYATEDELPVAEIERRIADFFAQDVIWRERERKGERYTYNLRPLVFELYLQSPIAKGAEGAKNGKDSSASGLAPRAETDVTLEASTSLPFFAPSAPSAPFAIRIFLRVQQRPGATGRPDEVVAALGLDDYPRTLQRDRLYFAANEEDAALFAQYPVIEQRAIAGPKPPPKPRPPKPEVRERGRSIGERAGDEFI